MRLVLKNLAISPLVYDSKMDPTRHELAEIDVVSNHFTKKEWTIGQRTVSATRKRLITADASVKSQPVKQNRKRKGGETDLNVQSKEEDEEAKEDIPLEVKKKEANVESTTTTR